VRFLGVRLRSSTVRRPRQRAPSRKFGNFIRRNRPGSSHHRGLSASDRPRLGEEGRLFALSANRLLAKSISSPEHFDDVHQEWLIGGDGAVKGLVTPCRTE